MGNSGITGCWQWLRFRFAWFLRSTITINAHFIVVTGSVANQSTVCRTLNILAGNFGILVGENRSALNFGDVLSGTGTSFKVALKYKGKIN